MASAQLEEPYEQTSYQIENSAYLRTSETRHNKNNSTNTHEDSLSDKVKGIAHSAQKLFNNHDHHGHGHTHNSTTNCSTGVKKEKKKIVKNTQGQHEGHCMRKMLNHVKNMKKKKNKKNNRGGGSSSDDDSSSDNDITKKKK